MVEMRELPQGGAQKVEWYEMTKDGFSFLVMGYTGTKAVHFKEMFIAEFNKREAMLKSDDYILMRSQQILQKELQRYLHKQNLNTKFAVFKFKSGMMPHFI